MFLKDASAKNISFLLSVVGCFAILRRALATAWTIPSMDLFGGGLGFSINISMSIAIAMDDSIDF